MREISHPFEDLAVPIFTAEEIIELIGRHQRGETVILDVPISHVLVACFIENEKAGLNPLEELAQWITDTFGPNPSAETLSESFIRLPRKRGRPKEIMNIDPIQVSAFIALRERSGLKRDEILAEAAEKFACSVRSIERNCRVDLNSLGFSDVFLKVLADRKRKRVS